MKKYRERAELNESPKTIIWLAVFGDLPLKFIEELSKLGIYYSLTKDIEQLEKLLGIK